MVGAETVNMLPGCSATFKCGQYTLDGKLVKIWNTPVETEQDGFRACSVREVLNGNQFKHKGYTFGYISWSELETINWKGQLNYGKQ